MSVTADSLVQLPHAAYLKYKRTSRRTRANRSPQELVTPLPRTTILAIDRHYVRYRTDKAFRMNND